MNKPLEIFEIPINKQKSIYTMPAPIKGAQQDFFAEDLRSLGITKVVSLLSTTEIEVHGLSLEEETYEQHQISYLNFPVTDFGTPKDLNGFIALVSCLVKDIKNEKKIVIHCKAGIGRSSLLAAAILIYFGRDATAVFSYISEFRGVKVPDKQSQIDWILSHESLFK